MSQSSAAPLVSFCDEEIFFLGLRRSGIHGVLSWLIPHLNGVTRLINDHDFRFGPGENPIHSDDPVLYYHSRAGQTAEITLNLDVSPIVEEHFRVSSAEFLAATPGWLRPFANSIIRKYRRSRAKMPKRYMQIPYEGTDLRVMANRNLFVFENMPPEQFVSLYAKWRSDVYAPFLASQGFAAPAKVRVIQLIREPWNQMASLLKNAPSRPPRVVGPDEFTDLWIDYAREFSGQTKFLSQVGSVTRISFPRWFSERDYRAGLAESLGVPLSDFGLEIVADFGGGSSFEAQAKQGKAQAMKVKERWMAFADEPRMKRLCGDDRVRALSQEIFGVDTPEQTRAGAA